MTRQIGPRTNVDSLKKEAKQWLKALRAGNADALARFTTALPEHAESITLRGVQLALAREHGFAGWPALTEAIGTRERELREVADQMLRHAIFKGDPAIAAQLFERHREVAKLDLFTAVAAGDREDVERRLAADPAAASRAGGPLDWPPLLYVTYMRLPGAAAQSLDIARALLDRGADPNARWNDGWDNDFTALTGVIALGEGVKPPHERADELAALLIERGADPVDTQAFYNTSIVGDDTHWLEVLWAHSERGGVTYKWRAVTKKLGGKIPMSPLDFMLSLAVSYNHPRRAQWLLAHGAHADSRQAYSHRSLRDEALVYGNDAMAELLTRHGAPDAPLQGKVAFQVACRRLDRGEARRLAASDPECLRDPELMLTAARERRLDIVQLLLDLGTDVDIEDRSGMRALNQAAGSGAVDIVKLLIERGADVDRPTKHYGGPMGFAAHFGQRATAQVLAPHSRDVHNMVFLGMKERLRDLFAAEPALVNLPHFRSALTPLFMLPAEESAALDMARFLLEHGADVSMRNKDGDRPADVARKRGFAALADVLNAATGAR
jgi:ankyrin repeat protein